MKRALDNYMQFLQKPKWPVRFVEGSTARFMGHANNSYDMSGRSMRNIDTENGENNVNSRPHLWSLPKRQPTATLPLVPMFDN